MPEIAEVEIVRRELDVLKGQLLLDFKAQGKLEARGHEDLLIGRRLDRVLRRGKQLGFKFGDRILLAHLRMTGRFAFASEKNARAELIFESGPVSFLDQRGFATMRIIEGREWPLDLGPDLWDVLRDQSWLPAERFRDSRRAIKASILDQKVVAGIGNYLADESLWRARVAPERSSAALSEKQWRDILESAGHLSLAVLNSGGVTIRDYRNSHGKAGKGQNRLLVYGRAGMECLRCGETLDKTRVAGRGTTWCPNCQS